MAARKRLFEAVFPAPTQKSLPTPQATPLIGTGSFVTSFGDDSLEDSAAEGILWERAWHHATTFLSLPSRPITLEEVSQSKEVIRSRWLKECSPSTADAVALVLAQRPSGIQPEDDLLSWYTQEVRRHYIECQLRVILNVLARDGALRPLDKTLHMLWVVQAIYVTPLQDYVVPKLPLAEGNFQLQNFKDNFQAMVSISLTRSNLDQMLRRAFNDLGTVIFRLEGSDEEDNEEDSMEVDKELVVTEARRQTASIVISLDDVGLGGAQAQRLFAEVMDDLLMIYVTKRYAGQWMSPSLVPAELRAWVQQEFSPFVIGILAYSNGGGGEGEEPSITKVTTEDIANWQQRAIYDLGELRLKELFDVVVDWDNGSRGAIEDLKHYVTTTSTRAHLVNQFSQVISTRLLQPGASTTEILQVYICIIRAFAILDPKGVLLDRLAKPIRRYLRDREDTVKIIVEGLLVDTEDDAAAETLKDLATELNTVTEVANEDEDAELDWDDMNWVPDPVDAGPEYKKSKSLDVIGTLISLFETKDVFVKEFQNILGERLLRHHREFDKEIRVLELLKLRFGEGALQACEVMLKDVLDSTRTDLWVKRERNIENVPVKIYTKILSRLFWPALHEESYIVPPDIKELQDEYSQGFERYKTSRKLAWLDVLGEVDIELELDDRTVSETVQTPHATVIYAFQDVGDTRKPVSKTKEQLVEQLEMDEDLVQNALMFWVGKLVLVKGENGSFSVLESLPAVATQEATPGKASESSTLAAAAAASASAAASALSAVRSEEDIAEEKMTIFWQFIVGMLTNQGSMPLQRIVMMLKLAVPGGFSYSNEDLRTFLGRRVDDGRLELVGGNYRLVKGKS